MVRPWNEFSSATSSIFSGEILRPCALAILSAASFASVPELQKKTRGNWLAREIRSARGPAYS